MEMDSLRDDEVHELKYKPGRLDMSHGFLHHIRRNQIARYSSSASSSMLTCSLKPCIASGNAITDFV